MATTVPRAVLASHAPVAKNRHPTVGRWIGLCAALCCFSAHAHTSDTSYLRAVLSKHALELRFTFDIATLHRITRLDADNDGKVSRAEAESAAPDVAAFLEEAITLEVNGQAADLGTLQPICWPADVGDAVEEKNYGQTLLHFTFFASSSKLIEDLYVLYEVFAQLGNAHRAVANIEQEGKHLEVVFTQFEPDYLYDTFWREGESATEEVGFDHKGSIRAAATLVWSAWWLPPATVAAYVFTFRWSDRRCFKWLLGVGFWFWLFAYATDSNPTPELGASVVGTVAAWWLMAFILWPLRTFTQIIWARRGPRQQKADES